MTGARSRLDVEYVLPLRWSPETSRREAARLGGYLEWLSRRVDVTVVDGSDAAEFTRHAAAWSRWVRHLPPAPWPGHNGKVAGVVTGVRSARHELVVIADDDVRYTDDTLAEVVRALDADDLVRPQSVLTPLVWHARWDTGRSLVNRAFGHDYPGTHGVRRSAFLAVGGYDGDVLFENLELARTFLAQDREVRDLPGCFVPRLAPGTAHFWSQRVRQAYDDLAQPARLVLELGLLPGATWAMLHMPRALAGLGAAVVAVAEVGRRRAGGTAVYEPTAALWALPWSAERAVCVWVALGQRAMGGAVYRGRRIPRAANSTRRLRRLDRPPLVSIGMVNPASRRSAPTGSNGRDWDCR